MKNKKNKIIYWISTAIISFMMIYSAYGYFTSEEMKSAFTHLGFPGYFRIELGVFKILGALAIILPFVHAKIKLIAYFGFALTFVSAFIAHSTVGDPVSVAIMPLIFLIILIVSYIFYTKRLAK